MLFSKLRHKMFSLCKEVDTTKLCSTEIQLGYFFCSQLPYFRYTESVGIFKHTQCDLGTLIIDDSITERHICDGLSMCWNRISIMDSSLFRSTRLRRFPIHNNKNTRHLESKKKIEKDDIK